MCSMAFFSRSCCPVQVPRTVPFTASPYRVRLQFRLQSCSGGARGPARLMDLPPPPHAKAALMAQAYCACAIITCPPSRVHRQPAALTHVLRCRSASEANYLLSELRVALACPSHASKPEAPLRRSPRGGDGCCVCVCAVMVAVMAT